MKLAFPEIMFTQTLEARVKAFMVNHLLAFLIERFL